MDSQSYTLKNGFKGKFDEAATLLAFGSKLNKRTLPEEFLKINDKIDVSIA